jgi:hypothetical protein
MAYLSDPVFLDDGMSRAEKEEAEEKINSHCLLSPNEDFSKEELGQRLLSSNNSRGGR